MHDRKDPLPGQNERISIASTCFVLFTSQKTNPYLVSSFFIFVLIYLRFQKVRP